VKYWLGPILAITAIGTGLNLSSPSFVRAQCLYWGLLGLYRCLVRELKSR